MSDLYLKRGEPPGSPSLILIKGNDCMRAIILSGFPGVGKTHFFKDEITLSKRIVMDSDSSKFDKKYFPSNYIQHIKDHMNRADIICVSSHKDVRDALVANKMSFFLIYPDKSLKEEYLDRYRKRESNKNFIQLLSDNWNTWIDELREQKQCVHVVLKSDEFLTVKLCDKVINRIHLTN